MSYLYTGETGTPLKEILDAYGPDSIDDIIVRCLWKDANGNPQDDLIGACWWKNGELKPKDGDIYSLTDLYIKWQKVERTLIVWEKGYLSNDWIN